MVIEDNVWVSVAYRLFESGGAPIEDVERSLTYLHGGYGAVFDAIEAALAGHEVGYETSLYIEPQDAFGDYDASLVHLVERDRLPAEIEEGMTFEGLPGESSDGGLYIVTDITDDVVVLDGNHPLAGMAVRFDLRVTDLRRATDEEIADEAARTDGEQSGQRPH